MPTLAGHYFTANLGDNSISILIKNQPVKLLCIGPFPIISVLAPH